MRDERAGVIETIAVSIKESQDVHPASRYLTCVKYLDRKTCARPSKND
jgi:hypothetical protein